LRDPYFLHEPISFSNSISYFERYYDNWTDTRVAFNSGLGYYFTPDLLGNLGLNVERVRISAPTVPTPIEVQDALGWSFETGVTAGFSHDTRDNPFLPGQGHLIKYTFEYMFGRFDYPIQKIDLRQYYTLGERPDGSGRQVLGFGSTIGFAGNATPVFDTFYAGGFSSLRGFAFRGVSPLDDGVAVGGDFEFLNTIEYNFPITADDVVRGVTFVDFGTVETNVDHFDGKDIRVSPGVGLRLQIPALGAAPIALDFAFPLNRLPGDQGQIFSFSISGAR
jgi:outer membrane protein insertion porin family